MKRRTMSPMNLFSPLHTPFEVKLCPWGHTEYLLKVRWERSKDLKNCSEPFMLLPILRWRQQVLCCWKQQQRVWVPAAAFIRSYYSRGQHKIIPAACCHFKLPWLVAGSWEQHSWVESCLYAQDYSSLFGPQQNGKTVKLFSQLTNSLWIDVAANRHPAETINKCFTSNLWIFHLLFVGQCCIFYSSAALPESVTVPDMNTAQSCHHSRVVDNTINTDFIVPTLLLVSSK